MEEQETETVTLEVAVPVLLLGVQVCPGGCVRTETLRIAAGHGSCEGEGSIRGHGQIIAAIILQNDGRTRIEAGDIRR